MLYFCFILVELGICPPILFIFFSSYVATLSLADNCSPSSSHPPQLSSSLLPRFLLQAADDLGVRAPRVESELLDVFRRYSWPGNTSELRGVISRAILVGGGGSLGRTSVPSSWLVEPNQADGNAVGANGSSPNGDDVHHHEGLAGGIRLTEAGIHLEHLERDLVIQALDMTRGNKTRAGRLLGLNRDQIRYRVEKFGLDPSAGKR